MRHEARSIRVLHVDDEPDFAELVATYVTREDDRFDIETATTASEGMDRLTSEAFDCVVSDYDMPGENGIEFLETVREDYPDLPFILYTGKGSEEIASDAISAGVTDYLQKESGTSHYTVLANRISNAVESYRSQKTVEATEQKLSQLAENSDEILFMFDSEWRELLFINSAYEDVWNQSIDELEANPQSFLDNIHPEDQDLVEQTLERILAGKPTSVEHRILTDEEEVRWIYSEAKPIYDNDGTFTRIVGFVRDITERKQHERELNKARERFQTIFEATNDAIFILDPDTETIIDANEQAVELLGYSRDELVSSVTLPDIHPGDIDQYREFIDQILTEDIGRRADFQCVTKAGEPKACELSVSSAEFDDNRYLIAVVRDMSERKQREQRLEQFASIVSHDLRNPLQVAKGHVELLQEECDSPHLEAIHTAHERMETLIEDLLTLAREDDPLTKTAEVDLSAVTDRCWANIETDDATLVSAVTRSVMADESQLQQLFENLFVNAVEHGGGDVTVRVGDLDDGFYVEDDGPGIADAAREKLFEPGYSTSETGTGFGLTIVEQVAEAHSWEIRVTEGSEGGARFEIRGVEFVAE